MPVYFVNQVTLNMTALDCTSEDLYWFVNCGISLSKDVLKAVKCEIKCIMMWVYITWWKKYCWSYLMDISWNFILQISQLILSISSKDVRRLSLCERLYFWGFFWFINHNFRLCWTALMTTLFCVWFWSGAIYSLSIYMVSVSYLDRDNGVDLRLFSSANTSVSVALIAAYFAICAYVLNNWCSFFCCNYFK